jgi:hypothetical protein
MAKRRNRTKNKSETNHLEDAPRLRLVDQKLSFAAITGGSLGDTFDDIDLDDGPSVQRVARRLLRYDPHTGWLFWAYKTAHQSLTPEQVLIATRATFYAGPGKKTGYINIGNRRFTAARVVWVVHKGVWPQSRLRHRNGNPSDDRMENLSDQPKPKVKKASEFKRKHPVGVCTMGPNHWQAYATFNCQRKFLGKFKTQEEAVAARARYDAGQDLF